MDNDIIRPSSAVTASAFHDSGSVNNTLFVKPSAITSSRTASPEAEPRCLTDQFLTDQFLKGKPQPIDLAIPTTKKAGKVRNNKKCNSRNPFSSSPSGRDSIKAFSNRGGSSRVNSSTSSDSDGRSRFSISFLENSDAERDSNTLNNSARKFAKHDNVEQEKLSVLM